METNICKEAVNEITFGSLWHRTWDGMRGNWGKAIGICLIEILIFSGAGMIPVLNFFSGLLLFPMTVGGMLFFLKIARREEANVLLIFEPFNEYGRMLWGYIRVTLFIFLFTLLLIIPGIIKTFAYALTYYVMLDHKELSVKECMEKSTELMKGYKFKLFLYGFLMSCIGGAFFVIGTAVCILLGGLLPKALSILSLIVIICSSAVYLFFFISFVTAFMANFYDAVKTIRTPPEEAPQQIAMIPAGPETDREETL